MEIAKAFGFNNPKKVEFLALSLDVNKLGRFKILFSVLAPYDKILAIYSQLNKILKAIIWTNSIVNKWKEKPALPFILRNAIALNDVLVAINC